MASTRTLVMQMGHVDRRTGATGTTGEQVFARAVAAELRDVMAGRRGWTLRVIHADEGSDRYDGDAFVAVHCDGSTNPVARGASVGYRNASGRDLGQAWKDAYERHGWPGDWRGDNYTDALKSFYGTRKAIAQGNLRALIVECGFLTSPRDRAALQGPGGARRVALAIADAVTGTSAPTTTPPATAQPAAPVEAPAPSEEDTMIRLVQIGTTDDRWVVDFGARTKWDVPDMATFHWLRDALGIKELAGPQPPHLFAGFRTVEPAA